MRSRKQPTSNTATATPKGFKALFSHPGSCIGHLLGTLLRTLSFQIFPGYCLLCGDKSGQHSEICQPCKRDLPLNDPCCTRCAAALSTPLLDNHLCGACIASPPTFDQCIAPLRYEFPVNKLISRFKFQGQFCHGALLAELLLAKIRSSHRHTAADLILPVPLHWRRQFMRGFNQSQWLANYLGHQLQIDVNHRVLKRHRHTPSQQGLKRKQRQKNLKGAFEIHDIRGSKKAAYAQSIAGKHIALVDDVVTTGSTALELSGLLKQAGAAGVDIWCLARTPLEK